MPDRSAAKDGAALRRRFRAARIERAFTGVGTAVITGGVIIAATTAYVLQSWDMLRTGTWAWALAAGLSVLVLKIAADLFDREDDADLWRSVLTAEFGEGMRDDADVTRQARLAIEFRVRLATAEARATVAARRLIADLQPRLDSWLDGIVRLARRVAAQRGEARFQSGLASRTAQRIGQIRAQAAGASDQAHAAQLQATADGLTAQMQAAEGLQRFLDSGYLKLENSVATFGTLTSQLVLILSRGAEDGGRGRIDAQIGEEIAAVERQLAMFDRAFAPGGALPPPVPELPPAADVLSGARPKVR
jgi:hypothetical protein